MHDTSLPDPQAGCVSHALLADADSGPLHAHWTRLAAETGQAEPFCCAPEWQLSAHEAFAPEGRPVVLTSPDGLLALAEHEPAAGMTVFTPLEASWCFGSPLLGKDAPELFEAFLAECEHAGAASFPRIILGGMRLETPSTRRLLFRLAGRFQIYIHSGSVQCSASLEGGPDGFLARRSANHRQKLRKAARRAREAGITFEAADPNSVEDARKIYSRMLAVERTSWKGLGRCGMAESPAREFYDLMIRRLARIGAARVMFARREERDIGFIFGGLLGTVYRGQQFSYADSVRESSVGNLLQLEQIVRLCAEGVTRYDMGPLSGPRMDYKRRWTEITTPIQTLLLVRR